MTTQPRKTQLWLAIFMTSYAVIGVGLPFLTLQKESWWVFNAFMAIMMVASALMFTVDAGHLIREMPGMRGRKDMIMMRRWVVPVAAVTGLVLNGADIFSSTLAGGLIGFFCGFILLLVILCILITLILRVDDSWSRVLHREKSS